MLKIKRLPSVKSFVFSRSFYSETKNCVNTKNVDNLSLYILNEFKVTRKFFLKHNKSFRWYLGDYEKHNFFPFEGL